MCRPRAGHAGRRPAHMGRRRSSRLQQGIKRAGATPHPIAARRSNLPSPLSLLSPIRRLVHAICIYAKATPPLPWSLRTLRCPSTPDLANVLYRRRILRGLWLRPPSSDRSIVHTPAVSEPCPPRACAIAAAREFSRNHQWRPSVSEFDPSFRLRLCTIACPPCKSHSRPALQTSVPDRPWSVCVLLPFHIPFLSASSMHHQSRIRSWHHVPHSSVREHIIASSAHSALRRHPQSTFVPFACPQGADRLATYGT